MVLGNAEKRRSGIECGQVSFSSRLSRLERIRLTGYPIGSDFVDAVMNGEHPNATTHFQSWFLARRAQLQARHTVSHYFDFPACQLQALTSPPRDSTGRREHQ